MIETKNFILRAWEESDSPFLYYYAKEAEIGKLTGWLPHKNEAESLELIRTIFAEEDVFAIYSKEKKHPIGSIGLHSTSSSKEREIGCWLGKEYWRKGFMSEIFSRILNYAFEDLGLERVIATSFVENIASAKLQEKFHFRLLGIEEEKQHPILKVPKKIRTAVLERKDWEEQIKKQ